jgi:hypothetical protein
MVYVGRSTAFDLTSMLTSLFLTGAVLLLLGGGLAASVYQENTACGSSIGLVSQGLNQTVAQDCRDYGLAFDSGVIIGLLGFVCLLGGAVLRNDESESPSAAPTNTV